MVTDNFPNDFRGVTYTATENGGASGFSSTGGGNVNDTVTLPAGSSITYKASGDVSSSASGTVSNTATVAPPSGESDSNPADNSSTDNDSIDFKADLKVTVSDATNTAVAGQKDTYTIKVINP